MPRYYCDDCHKDHHSPLPARVVLAWDFESYPVCTKAKVFLGEMNAQPIIDMKSFDENLLKMAPELQEVKKLI